jgi:hypothetical protein
MSVGTLRVAGLTFTASEGAWVHGCVRLKNVRGNWLATAPGASARADTPEVALKALVRRAGAIVAATAGLRP